MLHALLSDWVNYKPSSQKLPFKNQQKIFIKKSLNERGSKNIAVQSFLEKNRNVEVKKCRKFI